MRACHALYFLAAILALCGAAHAQSEQPCPGRESGALTPRAPGVNDPASPMEPAVAASWRWAMLQLLPSTGVVVAERQTDFALGWQLSPVLWSHAMDPRLSPWRFFVVEPVVRQSGSLELFLAPQYWATLPPGAKRWGSKLGVRTTVPVLHRGEYLSWSVASGYFWFPDDHGAMFETGAQIFFGVLGVSAGINLGQVNVSFQSMLELRIF